MAPRIPPSFPSCRGQHGGTAITISSGSDLSVPGNVIVVSSDSDEATSRPRGSARRRRPPPPSSSGMSVRSPVVNVAASSDRGGGGSDEATSGPRRAARRRRPPSPSFPSVTIRSPVGFAPVPSASGGDEATSGPRKAARRQRQPSPSSSAVSVRSPVGIGPAPSGSGGSGGGDEASSQPKRNGKYNTWILGDERKILATMADLRRENLGVRVQASVLLKNLRSERGLSRRLNVTELSDKVRQLKDNFASTAARIANGGKPPRRNWRKVLYKMSQEAWLDMYADAGAAYLAAKAARRRRQCSPLMASTFRRTFVI